MIVLNIEPMGTVGDYLGRINTETSYGDLDGIIIDISAKEEAVQISGHWGRTLVDFAPYSLPDFKSMIISIPLGFEKNLIAGGDGVIEGNLKRMSIPYTKDDSEISVGVSSLAEYQKIFHGLGFKDPVGFTINRDDTRISVSDGLEDMSGALEKGMLNNSEGYVSFDFESKSIGPSFLSAGESVSNAPTSLSGVSFKLSSVNGSMRVSIDGFSDEFFNTPITAEIAKLTGLTGIDLSTMDPPHLVDCDGNSKIVGFFKAVIGSGSIFAGHSILGFDLPLFSSLYPNLTKGGGKIKFFDTLQNSTSVPVVADGKKTESKKQVDLVANVLAPKKKGLNIVLGQVSHRSIVDCLSSVFLVASIRAKTLGIESFTVEKNDKVKHLLDFLSKDNQKYHDFIVNFIGVEISVAHGPPSEIVEKALSSLGISTDSGADIAVRF